MKYRALTGIGIVVLIFAGLASCSHKGPTQWDGTLRWVNTSALYDHQQAKRDHSLLFVVTTWCGWCKRLKNETLTDTAVCQLLSESFNIAEIDADSDSLVGYMDTTVTCRYLSGTIYHVGGYPTTVVLTKEGKLIGTIPGYKNAADFKALLIRIRDGEFDPR